VLREWDLLYLLSVFGVVLLFLQLRLVTVVWRLKPSSKDERFSRFGANSMKICRVKTGDAPT